MNFPATLMGTTGKSVDEIYNLHQKGAGRIDSNFSLPPNPSSTLPPNPRAKRNRTNTSQQAQSHDSSSAAASSSTMIQQKRSNALRTPSPVPPHPVPSSLKTSGARTGDHTPKSRNPTLNKLEDAMLSTAPAWAGLPPPSQNTTNSPPTHVLQKQNQSAIDHALEDLSKLTTSSPDKVATTAAAAASAYADEQRKARENLRALRGNMSSSSDEKGTSASLLDANQGIATQALVHALEMTDPTRVQSYETRLHRIERLLQALSEKSIKYDETRRATAILAANEQMRELERVYMDEEQLTQYNSATLIQSVWRGHLQRNSSTRAQAALARWRVRELSDFTKVIKNWQTERAGYFEEVEAYHDRCLRRRCVLILKLWREWIEMKKQKNAELIRIRRIIQRNHEHLLLNRCFSAWRHQTFGPHSLRQLRARRAQQAADARSRLISEALKKAEEDAAAKGLETVNVAMVIAHVTEAAVRNEVLKEIEGECDAMYRHNLQLHCFLDWWSYLLEARHEHAQEERALNHYVQRTYRHVFDHMRSEAAKAKAEGLQRFGFRKNARVHHYRKMVEQMRKVFLAWRAYAKPHQQARRMALAHDRAFLARAWSELRAQVAIQHNLRERVITAWRSDMYVFPALCFRHWRQFVAMVNAQRQAHEVIASFLLRRVEKKLLKNAFEGWKEGIMSEKDLRDKRHKEFQLFKQSVLNATREKTPAGRKTPGSAVSDSNMPSDLVDAHDAIVADMSNALKIAQAALLRREQALVRRDEELAQAQLTAAAAQADARRLRQLLERILHAASIPIETDPTAVNGARSMSDAPLSTPTARSNARTFNTQMPPDAKAPPSTPLSPSPPELTSSRPQSSIPAKAQTHTSTSSRPHTASTPSSTGRTEENVTASSEHTEAHSSSSSSSSSEVKGSKKQLTAGNEAEDAAQPAVPQSPPALTRPPVSTNEPRAPKLTIEVTTTPKTPKSQPSLSENESNLVASLNSARLSTEAAQREASAARSALNELEMKYQLLTSQLKSTQEELKEKQEAVNTATAEKESLQAEKAEQRHQLAVIKQENEAQATELAALREQLRLLDFTTSLSDSESRRTTATARPRTMASTLGLDEPIPEETAPNASKEEETKEGELKTETEKTDGKGTDAEQSDKTQSAVKNEKPKSAETEKHNNDQKEQSQSESPAENQTSPQGAPSEKPDNKSDAKDTKDASSSSSSSPAPAVPTPEEIAKQQLEKTASVFETIVEGQFHRRLAEASLVWQPSAPAASDLVAAHRAHVQIEASEIRSLKARRRQLLHEQSVATFNLQNHPTATGKQSHNNKKAATQAMPASKNSKQALGMSPSVSYLALPVASPTLMGQSNSPAESDTSANETKTISEALAEQIRLLGDNIKRPLSTDLVSEMKNQLNTISELVLKKLSQPPETENKSTEQKNQEGTETEKQTEQKTETPTATSDHPTQETEQQGKSKSPQPTEQPESSAADGSTTQPAESAETQKKAEESPTAENSTQPESASVSPSHPHYIHPAYSLPYSNSNPFLDLVVQSAYVYTDQLAPSDIASVKLLDTRMQLKDLKEKLKEGSSSDVETASPPHPDTLSPLAQKSSVAQLPPSDPSTSPDGASTSSTVSASFDSLFTLTTSFAYYISDLLQQLHQSRLKTAAEADLRHKAEESAKHEKQIAQHVMKQMKERTQLLNDAMKQAYGSSEAASSYDVKSLTRSASRYNQLPISPSTTSLAALSPLSPQTPTSSMEVAETPVSVEPSTTPNDVTNPPPQPRLSPHGPTHRLRTRTRTPQHDSRKQEAEGASKLPSQPKRSSSPIIRQRTENSTVHKQGEAESSTGDVHVQLQSSLDQMDNDPEIPSKGISGYRPYYYRTNPPVPTNGNILRMSSAEHDASVKQIGAHRKNIFAAPMTPPSTSLRKSLPSSPSASRLPSKQATIVDPELLQAERDAASKFRQSGTKTPTRLPSPHALYHRPQSPSSPLLSSSMDSLPPVIVEHPPATDTSKSILPALLQQSQQNKGFAMQSQLRKSTNTPFGSSTNAPSSLGNLRSSASSTKRSSTPTSSPLLSAVNSATSRLADMGRSSLSNARPSYSRIRSPDTITHSNASLLSTADMNQTWSPSTSVPLRTPTPTSSKT